MTLSETSLQTERQGYWATHPYNRLNVEEYVEKFCGWQALTELINLIYDEKQKAFFVTMFQTGGRVTEVLLLKKYNFTVLPDEGIVKVTQMRLLKRYEKLDNYVDTEGKNRWHTQRLVKFRKTFTIQRREPFTLILENYLKQVNGPDVYLFASPYTHSRRYVKRHLPSEEVKLHAEDVNGQVPYTPQ
jgi:integrase